MVLQHCWTATRMRTQYFHHSAPTRRLLSFVGACCFFAASSFAEQGPWTEWTAAIPDRANIAEFPSHYRAIQIDLNAVKASLVRPAAKGIRDARILLLPRPDGGSQAFEVTASGVLPAALAHKYPSQWSKSTSFRVSWPLDCRPNPRQR